MRVGLMAMERLSDEIGLMAHPFVIHARTSPDGLFNRQAGNHGEYGRTGCGIPNAHLAGSNQIVALGAIHSDLNGSNRLLLGHRRMLDEVLGASAYLFRNEAGPLLKVVIDADIDDNDFQERSEEHTSELQSRLHLVCRLLLEKKKMRDAWHS